MKLFRFLTIATLFIMPCLSAQENETKPEENIILNEEQVNNLDFDKLRENAEDSNVRLSDVVKEEIPSTAQCVGCMYGASSAVVPYSQGFSYIKGTFCHVANYVHGSIITVFEGYNYGLQTTVDYYGNVIAVNYSPVVEYSPAGTTFKHYYPDCSVVTGMDQIILFY